MSFKVVITGGCGFMGSHFANTVARQYPQWEVHVLDSLTYAAQPQLLIDAPNLTFTRGDIRNPNDVSPVTCNADLIVNFAAETHNDRSLTNPHLFTQTNVIGTEVLLGAARESGAHFHQISTDEVYGDAGGDGVVFRPEAALHPSSPYSASKAAADLLVIAWQRSFGVRASISRSVNNYGCGQNSEKFIPRQILRALHGEPLVVYGDGIQRRDWLHISDHTAAVLAIVTHELQQDPGYPKRGSAYHIGSDILHTNVEIAQFIAKKFGVDIEFVADRPGHDHSYQLDTTNTRALGWEPAVEFTDGLAQTIQWYSENEPLWREAFAESEAFYRAT